MIKIAILATGDELVNGDILNTNGQKIAQKLVENGLTVGHHVVVSDSEEDINSALASLMRQHQVIIITGGLGPTSDDRTRFAISKLTAQPLIFNDSWWEAIVKRITSLGLTVHKANRQQALFPKEATVFPNSNGTAAGFGLIQNACQLYCLPGPPGECLPMFNQYVLNGLIKQENVGKAIHKRWRLFGVSEGEIAAYLDEALAAYPLQTAYRIDYPYLEFKIRAFEKTVLASLMPMIEKLVEPHLLSHGTLSASEFLRLNLEQIKAPLIIDDEATGGLLQSKLLTPNTLNKVKFKPVEPNDLTVFAVVIQGLNEFWQNREENGDTNLTFTFHRQGKSQQHSYTLPYRKTFVRDYAVEFISHQINRFLMFC